MLLISHVLRRGAGRLLDLVAIVSDLTSDSKSQVIRVIDSDNNASSVLKIIFLCYGPEIRKEHVQFLQVMHQEGYGIYVVRQGFGAAEDQGIRFASIIYRHNTGRDLAAFRDASKLVILHKFHPDGVTVFLNDTMNWNREVIHRLISTFKSGTQLVGVTTSYQVCKHIQTYGFAVRDESLKKVFDVANWKNWKHKRTIVSLGELSFAKKMFRSGIKFETLIDGWELQMAMLDSKNFKKTKKNVIRKSADFPMNPTKEMADNLAEKLFGLRKF